MGGGAGPGPDMLLQALQQLQQSPPPDAEQEALRDATMKISMALSRIQLRSAKAARLLSESLGKLQSAREALDTEASRPMAPPPSLGMPPMGGLAGGPPPGMGAPGPMGM